MLRPLLPIGRLPYSLIYLIGLPGLLATLALGVQKSRIDIACTRLFYDATSQRFPWNDQPWLELLGHKLLLALPLGVALASLVIMAFQCRTHAPRRQWLPYALLLLAMIAVPILVQWLKGYTALPRPYRLSLFGGELHWPDRWFAFGGQAAGRALPSNHAAAGYSIALLYFLGWALQRPWLRWGGLTAGVALGLLFGAVRIMQGAHFLSQTLWSAALVCLVGGLCFLPLVRKDDNPERHPRRPRAGR